MSAHLNEVRLIGRLTRDPELRATPTGRPVASFGLATSKKYRTTEGVWKEDILFIDVSCWGKLAETVAKHLKKGRQVFVGGRLHMDQWEDAVYQKKHTKISMVAEDVQFLDPVNTGYAPVAPPESVAASYIEPKPNSPEDVGFVTVPMEEPPF